MVLVYHRDNNEVREGVDYGSTVLSRVYEKKSGGILLPLLIAPIMSSLLTLWDYTPFSRLKIDDFVTKYGITLSDYVEPAYPNFAAFFIRKKRPEVIELADDHQVLAVADAKLSVHEISQEATVEVKGQTYQLADLLNDVQLAQAFEGGLLFLYRLGLEDYHRYLASESGRVLAHRSIFGKLHSVRQMATSRYPVFKENRRLYTLLDTPNRGWVLQMAVGALLVGRIIQPERPSWTRGQEIGHFGLGGSSILVCYQASQVRVDADIWQYSQKGIETQVYLGQV